MSHNPKLLLIKQILEEKTDAEHGLSMKSIIEHLAEAGISAERKGIYRDIKTLREFGVDIQTYQRNPIEYAIEKRSLSMDELMLLIDAVASCKSITERQAKSLTDSLKLMTSEHQRRLLNRRIHVVGRIKTQSEGVFDKIDTIHNAVSGKRRIEFKYFHIGSDGRKHASNDGLPYSVTPVAISYDDGFYYLTAFDERLNNFREFRLDRIASIVISENRAAITKEISNFKFERNDNEYFGRFDGEPITATLRVDEGKAEIIFDRFGDDAKIFPQNDGSAKAVVKIRKSPQFFGWIAGLANMVRIEKPQSLKNEYSSYLRSLLA